MGDRIDELVECLRNRKAGTEVYEHALNELASLARAGQAAEEALRIHTETAANYDPSTVARAALAGAEMAKKAPSQPAPAGHPRYSDDRLSLAQEIAETLMARGHWVPKEFAGPDLITAVGQALEKQPAPAGAVPERVVLPDFVRRWCDDIDKRWHSARIASTASNAWEKDVADWIRSLPAPSSALGGGEGDGLTVQWNDPVLNEVDDLQDFLDGMSLDAKDSRLREALRRLRSKLWRGGEP